MRTLEQLENSPRDMSGGTGALSEGVGGGGPALPEGEEGGGPALPESEEVRRLLGRFIM